jgi:hypothetical protein
MEPEPNEVAEVRPIFKNVSTKCFTCHKDLVIRKPSHDEQVIMLQFLREKWDLSVTKPEDIYLMGEPCECGQPVQAYFEINADKLK